MKADAERAGCYCRWCDSGLIDPCATAAQAADCPNYLDEVREARESGDTATANRLMGEQRAKMDAQRDKQAAAIRAILTNEQQAQFDKNLTEMKQREAQFPGARGRGRPPGPPRD